MNKKDNVHMLIYALEILRKKEDLTDTRVTKALGLSWSQLNVPKNVTTATFWVRFLQLYHSVPGISVCSLDFVYASGTFVLTPAFEVFNTRLKQDVEDKMGDNNGK